MRAPGADDFDAMSKLAQPIAKAAERNCDAVDIGHEGIGDDLDPEGLFSG